MKLECDYRAWHQRMDGTGEMIPWEKVIPNFEQHLDDDLLLQFTGERDQDGIKIYDQDIVKVEHVIYNAYYDIRKTHTTIKVVNFGEVGEEEGFDWLLGEDVLRGIDKYDNPFWTREKTTFKVMGNVYENPELLETLTR